MTIRRHTAALALFAFLVAAAPLAAQQRAPVELLAQILPIAFRIDNYVLVADDDVTVPVPAGYDLAVYSAKGGTFWISTGASCAVPTTTVTNGSGVEPNPSARRVTGISAFCIVTDEAGVIVSIAWYRMRLL